MKFDLVLKKISEFLEKRGSQYAVIGGIGMAIYGIPRTTLDLDIVVPRDIQKELVSFLENQGYETLYVSEGYSNHLHDDLKKGRVDVVYVSGQTSRKLFGESRTVEGPGGLKVRILRPEHFIALKVFAIRNNPSRTLQDMADIGFLMGLPGIDRVQVKGYFKRYGVEELYEQLEKYLE